jgi:DNA-binding NtrC family response regulator
VNRRELLISLNLLAMAPLTVCVVDDEKVIADTVSLILRAAGFQVTTFYGGSAVVAAHGIHPTPDVVVTDFALDGLALAAWLEERHPECRIVMITGQAALLGKCADRGAHFTVLGKPIPPPRLIEAVSGKAA